jgi:hypothetical protein
MMDLSKEYSLAANTFIFGPLNLSGFGDDGAVEYAPIAEDDAEIVTGYDGGATVNWILDFGVIATISLRETARSYRELGALLQAQRLLVSQGQPSAPYPWTHIDAFNGDNLSIADARLIGGPGLSKTNRFSVRPFKVFLPNAKQLMRYGTAIR